MHYLNATKEFGSAGVSILPGTGHHDVTCSATGITCRGALRIAGVVTRTHITGKLVNGQRRGRADVWSADTASIQNGAALIRTAAGCRAHGRTNTDCFVFIPFMCRGRMKPTVMHVKQLLLVKKAGLGWPNDEARIAVGTLYEDLTIAKGVGLETDFNENRHERACCMPRVLKASRAQMTSGYTWAVHVRQIRCPVIHVPGNAPRSMNEDGWDALVTYSKMGFHGIVDARDN